MVPKFHFIVVVDPTHYLHRMQQILNEFDGITKKMEKFKVGNIREIKLFYSRFSEALSLCSTTTFLKFFQAASAKKLTKGARRGVKFLLKV